MFRFVVLDLPHLAAFIAFCALAFVMYMLHRDTRLLVQMLIDMKEELAISSMERNRDSQVRSGEQVTSDEHQEPHEVGERGRSVATPPQDVADSAQHPPRDDRANDKVTLSSADDASE